MNKIMQILKNY